jgi:uncharacterized protein (DUF2336 family)
MRMTLPSSLSQLDIRRLFKGGDPDARALVAQSLCRAAERAVLTDADRAAAEEVIRILAADTAERVRRALALTLKASPLIPRDVALKLARDVESVALPVISGSPAFTDDDLIEIVKTGRGERQTAVASRTSLSPRVTGIVAVFGTEAAVAVACANDNAVFSEIGLQRALDRFPRSEAVTTAIAYRATLPVAVAERLVDLVGEAVRKHLLDRHALKLETALRLTAAARERVTVDLVDQAGASADLPGFAAHLHRSGRLNASLLLRALAHGQMSFFEHALAELAAVPHHRTWLMVHDGGSLGFRAVYDRAGLPSRLFAAFRAGLDAWRSLQAEGLDLDREAFQTRMLERFLTQNPFAPREDVAYLMEKLNRAADDLRPPAHANAA